MICKYVKYSYCDNFFHAEPKMKDIILIALRQLEAYWESIAYILDYDTPAIDAIKEQHHADPHNCCQELLRNWLEVKHSADKKTWFTLLDSIGEDEHFTRSIEVILEKLENKYG